MKFELVGPAAIRQIMLKVRYEEGNSIEVGVDEAGRGCLWGPLYAGAVIWPPEEEWLEEHRELSPLIRDSKKLSEKKRHILAKSIENLAISYGIGIVQAQEIDRLGMTEANRLAFVRAIAATSVQADRVLLDGTLNLTDEQCDTLKCAEYITVVDGDATYLPIAAASIVAKVHRDTWVKTYVEQNPQLQERYNLLNNKGYGAEKHRKGVLDHGVHEEHRRLFLRKLLGTSKCLIQDD